MTDTKPHRATNPKPVQRPETPPYGQFWVVSLASAGTDERRVKHEALARAQFDASLKRQRRRPVLPAQLTWVGARLKRGVRLGDGCTPLMTDLKVCLPGQAPTWWILAVTAPTMGRL